MKSVAMRGVVCAGAIVLALASTPTDARTQEVPNVALFHDDFVYMAPGAPAVTTREALIEVADAGFRNRASIEIEPVEIHVSSDRAFARTEVSGSVEVAGTGELSPAACEGGPTLTYLANAAVLIRGTNTVLIDGPFTEGVEPYPKLISETLRRARTAEPPFDEVDWVLVTHEHADHGDARAIADLLRANRSARLVSTRPVVEQVRAAADGKAGVAGRLVVADPAEGEPIVVSDGSPRIEVMTLHHGRRRAVENLGFLVDVDGVRVLHAGDAEVVLSDIEPLALSEREIDVALMPTWYARNDRYLPVLDELAAPHVLLMHFPERRAGDRVFRRSGGWDAVMRTLAEVEPPLVPLVRRDQVYCLDPFGGPFATLQDSKH